MRTRPGHDSNSDTAEPSTLPQRDTDVAPPQLSSDTLDAGRSTTSMETVSAPPIIGSVISDRYRIDWLIGSGGMGDVYCGEQIHLRKRVAIKLLSPGAQRSPNIVMRFEREAIAGAHIDHPNVAAAIDFGHTDDDRPFLILEFVEGVRLSDIISRGPMPAERALAIAKQIASALVAIHEKGIIHRDLKPENILIDDKDRVKIIDFGFAKIRPDLVTKQSRGAGQDVALTAGGVLFGTAAYMAPEAALGMDAVDARSDLYALGVVLYEMLCGKRPFDVTDIVAVLAVQRLEDPPALGQRVPGVSIDPEVEAVVMRLIQRNPDDRYATAVEALERIEAVASAAKEPKPRVTIPIPIAAEPSQSRFSLTVQRTAKAIPGWVVVAVAVGSLVIGSFVVLAIVPDKAKPSEGPAETSAPSTSASAEAVPSASASPPPTASHAPSSRASVQAVTASASASSEAPPAAVDGIDAAAWRARLREAAKKKNWFDGAKALVALARVDPPVLEDPKLRETLVAIVAGIAFEEGSHADEVFTVLGEKSGTAGLDVLYDVTQMRGGTAGGRRANAILSKPAALKKASPALRVALELHSASCEGKRRLLERAASDGDSRALRQLEALRPVKCSSKKDPCCLRDDPAADSAVRRIKTRVASPQ